jgi:hypothetical protein
MCGRSTGEIPDLSASASKLVPRPYPIGWKSVLRYQSPSVLEMTETKKGETTVLNRFLIALMVAFRKL